MKIKADVVLREIAGDFVLVPTGETVTKYNGLFSLSEVGARIWELIEKSLSEDEIVKVLLEEYSVEEEELRRDVSDFTLELYKMGFIE